MDRWVVASDIVEYINKNCNPEIGTEQLTQEIVSIIENHIENY